MISYLRGRVVWRHPRYLIVENGGVGYKVFLASTNLDKIKSEVELFCCLKLKEKEMDLYGFLSPEEMEFFERLLKISGIGPKSALEISASTTLAEIEKSDNPEALLMVSKKKARAIILDLVGEVKGDTEDETATALLQLGFPKRSVMAVLKKIPPGDVTERVKEALKILR
jgi:holliday junction DNA helicase RuvA